MFTYKIKLLLVEVQYLIFYNLRMFIRSVKKPVKIKNQKKIK
jgi:hypothetical protein